MNKKQKVYCSECKYATSSIVCDIKKIYRLVDTFYKQEKLSVLMEHLNKNNNCKFYEKGNPKYSELIARYAIKVLEKD